MKITENIEDILLMGQPNSQLTMKPKKWIIECKEAQSKVPH